MYDGEGVSYIVPISHSPSMPSACQYHPRGNPGLLLTLLFIFHTWIRFHR